VSEGGGIIYRCLRCCMMFYHVGDVIKTDSAHVRSSHMLRSDVSKPSTQNTKEVGDTAIYGFNNRSARQSRSSAGLVKNAGARCVAFPGVEYTEHDRVEIPHESSSSTSRRSRRVGGVKHGASARGTNRSAGGVGAIGAGAAILGVPALPLSRQKCKFLQSRPNLHRP